MMVSMKQQDLLAAECFGAGCTPWSFSSDGRVFITPTDLAYLLKSSLQFKLNVIHQEGIKDGAKMDLNTLRIIIESDLSKPGEVAYSLLLKVILHK